MTRADETIYIESECPYCGVQLDWTIQPSGINLVEGDCDTCTDCGGRFELRVREIKATAIVRDEYTGLPPKTKPNAGTGVGE